MDVSTGSLSFRSKILWSAAALLVFSMSAAVAAVFLTSRAVIAANLRASATHQVELTAGYVDVVYEEALRSLELIEQDGYVLSLARTLYSETQAFERSQIALQLATYLNVRYFGQQEFSSLFILSDKFLIGNRAREGSSVETVSVLSPQSSELIAEGTSEGILEYLSVNSSPPSAVVDPRQLLSISLGHKLYLAGSVDLSAALATFEQPAAVIDADGDVLASNPTMDELGLDESIMRAQLGTRMEIEAGATFGRYYAVAHRTKLGELMLAQLFDVTAVFRSLRSLLLMSAAIGIGFALLWILVMAAILRRVTAPLDDFNRALRTTSPADPKAFAGLIRRYRRRSRLQHGLRWFFLSLVIPVALSITLLFVLFRGFIYDQRSDEFLTELKNEARNLSFEVQTLREYGVMLALDPEMQAALSRRFGEQPETTRRAFSELIFRKGTLLRDVSHVALYGGDLGVIYPSSDIPGDTARSNPTPAFRYRSQNVAWLLGPDTDDASLLIRVRGVPSPVHSVTFLRELGFIEIRSRNIFQTISMAGSSGLTDIKLVLDIESRVVRQLTGERLPDPARVLGVLPAAASAPGETRIETATHIYNTTFYPVEGTNWMLVHLITDSELRSGAQVMIYYGVIILLGLVLLVYVLSDLATNRLLKPLDELHSWMETVALDRSDSPAIEHVGNEFVQLVAGFAGMLDRLRTMAEEVRRKEVERVELDRRKKETQLIALQTQMNPHFLYNIFSSVDFLIDLGRQAEASRMLEATGQLFRKGMYRGRLVVPLSEELEHTRAYLAIQDIRHRNRITVSWHVDQSLENTRVPKFILQPLIENSIEHGMEKSKGITIRIYIQRVEDALRIVVEDNGNGIEPAKLRELRRSLEKGEQSEHLGLANVNERVCLHHGVRQPLRVSSTVGKGCHVELTIPRERTADGSDIERGAPNPQSERGVETAHRGR